jgi:NADH:ubiquinone oxidoreductase subunit H
MLNFFLKPLFFILNLTIIVLFILLGGVLPLLERKFLSLTHRRVGPKFVGYKGRFQFIADALKLLLKEFIIPSKTNKSFFFLSSITLLNVNLFLTLNIVFLKNICFLQNNYNLLYVLLIEMFTNVILFYIGFFVKNKYTQISSFRVLNLLFLFEVLISLFFLFIFLKLKNFSYSSLVFFKFNPLNLLNYFLLNPLFFYIFLIFIKKTPIDLVEAETEIIMGYHSEHSGFLAGSLILIEYIHLFF